MSTLSQFYGSSSGGGGASGVQSAFKVFYETGSITLPSCTCYVAYGVIGGGGLYATFCSNCINCRHSGSGAGFSWKDGDISCASDFTVCVTVGAAATVQPCNSYAMVNCGCGGTSSITGLSTGVICATGGQWGQNRGCGIGGDINTCGGPGAFNALQGGGGGGAGGLNGNGGGSQFSCAGGGYGSGGGGGGSGNKGNLENYQCDFCCQMCCCASAHYSAEGGGGGSHGSLGSGGAGLSGRGGNQIGGSACGNDTAMAMYGPEGGLIPQYTISGYSQAKTFLSASGGGGAASGMDTICSKCFFHAQGGAPGGGGGVGTASTQRANGGSGGFGAGGGAGGQCSGSGNSGIGAGAAMNRPAGNDYATPGRPGQGIGVLEYWVTRG